MIEAELPDGRVLEFPDGTDPSVIQAAVKKLLAPTQQAQIPAPQPASSPQPPSQAAQLAANPLTRFAVGAASPVMGAGEWLPGELGKFFAENNAEMKRLVEEGKIDQSDVMKVLGGTGDVAGTILSPAFLKIAQYIPAAKSIWQMAASGAGLGALSGATAPTGSAELKDKAVATGTGALVGGVATPVVSSIFRGFTNLLAPMVSERAAERGAARMATKVVGEERAPSVAQAMTTATPTQNAAQAAAPVGSYEMSALQKLMQPNLPTEYGRIAQGAEATRMANLRAVTPDQAAAEAAREAASKANYSAAFNDMVKVDPKLAQMASNPYFQQAQKEVDTLLASRGITFQSSPVAYLHHIKLGFDKMLGRKGDTALGAGEIREVARQKSDLLNWLAAKSPNYDKARADFAKMSEPINQASVLNRMAAELEKPTGTGERVTPFLNVLGKGEEALIKKSTGQPRYVVGDLQKVLTPQQFAVVDDIANQLKSGAQIDDMANKGMTAALKAIRASESKDVRLPGLLNYKITVINSLLNRLEGIGGGKIEKKAAELMMPGQVQKLGGLMQDYQANPFGMFGTAMRYQGGVPSLFSREPIDVGTME